MILSRLQPVRIPGRVVVYPEVSISIFAGFIEFMSQDMVFWPLTGLFCLFAISVPIVLVIVLIRVNQKAKTRRERDEYANE